MVRYNIDYDFVQNATIAAHLKTILALEGPVNDIEQRSESVLLGSSQAKRRLQWKYKFSIFTGLIAFLFVLY